MTNTEKDILLKNSYDVFLNSNSKDELIPRKIHQIWLGDVPSKVIDFSRTIIDLHPNWEYKLWGYDDINKLNIKNTELFNSTTNRGAQSDILRYEILFNEGGIYLDTDFYMVKTFESLLHLEFFSGNGANDPEVFNGLFGCIPNHPILENIITHLFNSKNVNLHNIDDIMNNSGPYLFAKYVFSYLKDNPTDKVVILPNEYFYSLPADDRYMLRGNNYDKNFIIKNLTDKSICVHLWENSWQ